MLKITQDSKLFNLNDQSSYVSLEKIKIAVVIRSLIADVTLTQVFRNDDKIPIDVTYYFPIKNQVTVSAFTAQIDNQDVSQQGKRLEDDFVVNIGTLLPSKEWTINISYTIKLNVVNTSTIQLIFPAAILSAINSKSENNHGIPCTIKFHREMEATNEFQQQQRITHITSSSHPIEFNVNEQNTYSMVFNRSHSYSNDDFVLNIELYGSFTTPKLDNPKTTSFNSNSSISPINVITTNRIGQPFDYYCVLDFEAVCHQAIPGSKRQSPNDIWEIIEFPICLLEAETNSIIDIYHSYVRPTIKSTLNNICINITGITQHMVDNSPTFDIVWKHVQRFLSKHSLIPSEENQLNSLYSFTWIICGNWDIRTMLPLQLKQSGLNRPKYIDNFINIKDLYMEYYPNTQIRGMKDLLRKTKLNLEGQHHSGIDDTKNIARIAQWFIQNNKILKLTS